MGREDWEYLPVKKDTRTAVEKVRAFLILQTGKKQTYDDTINYLLRFLPKEVKSIIGDPQ